MYHFLVFNPESFLKWSFWCRCCAVLSEPHTERSCSEEEEQLKPQQTAEEEQGGGRFFILQPPSLQSDQTACRAAVKVYGNTLRLTSFCLRADGHVGGVSEVWVRLKDEGHRCEYRGVFLFFVFLALNNLLNRSHEMQRGGEDLGWPVTSKAIHLELLQLTLDHFPAGCC